MKKQLFLLFAMLSLQVSTAQPPLLTPANTNIDISMVDAMVHADGSLFWDLVGNPRFEVPKGSGRHTVFATNLWMGAMDANANIRCSAQHYRQNGTDYGFGPISDSQHYNATFDAQWNKIWKINKTEVDNHILHWADANYQVPSSIAEYPGNGDVSKGQDAILAPYQDVNGNNTYDPQNGDYPLIKGDQSVLFLINDLNCTHTVTSGVPLGVQILGTLYAFNHPTDAILNHTLFLSYAITNHSGQPYTNYKAGLWSDLDVGNYADDYIGSDSAHSFFFAYNGDNDDEGSTGYGPNPPAEAVAFLSHQMESFVSYNNDWSVIGNPQTSFDYYNYLSSKWKDGQGFVNNGMNGHPGTVSGSPTSYIFNGDVCTGTGWTEAAANNTASDRRGLGVANIPNFPDGATVNVDFAFVYARGNSNVKSVCELQNDVTHIQTLYLNGALSNNYAIITSPLLLIEVFPNPVHDQLIVKFNDEKTHELSFYNALGTKLWQATELRKEVQIPVHQYPKGVYFVKEGKNLQKILVD